MADSARAASCELDEAVLPAAKDLRSELGAPDALFLLGTGPGLLESSFERVRSRPLKSVPGVPPAWREVELFAGRHGGLDVWWLTDAPGPVEFGEAAPEREPAWSRGFPCWLARAAGAEVLVHGSAGTSLAGAGASAAPALGEIALVSDHLNLSGTTPLRGLGPTRLGPLFPDVSRMHDAPLRQQTASLARKLGIAAREAVVACTVGPALDTAAERRWFAQAGATVAVQGLAGPLLASAHAGLQVLALCAVTDPGEGPTDLAALLAQADRLAPVLDELLLALCPPIAARVRSLRSDR